MPIEIFIYSTGYFAALYSMYLQNQYQHISWVKRFLGKSNFITSLMLSLFSWGWFAIILIGLIIIQLDTTRRLRYKKEHSSINESVSPKSKVQNFIQKFEGENNV